MKEKCAGVSDETLSWLKQCLSERIYPDEFFGIFRKYAQLLKAVDCDYNRLAVLEVPYCVSEDGEYVVYVEFRPRGFGQHGQVIVLVMV